MASFTVALKSWVSSTFAPLTHASRHASAGADPITPAAIGAAAADDSRIVGLTAPIIRGRAAGLLYDGTDETATLQSIITALSTAGGGVIELDGIVRCDGQITFPTVIRDNRLHMAPIRITGQVAPSSGAWPPYSGGSPYPSAGLDLRYAGRTDVGCATTKGSAYVSNSAATAGDRGQIVSGAGIPGRSYILHVTPGAGWTLNKAARATATTPLTTFGGRMQGFGYGKLEIDHLQIVTGAPTSAPFGVTTGPTAYIHDNQFLGYATKSGTSCDEDAWLFGGPGQGTVTTAELVAGVPVTTIPVASLPVALRDAGPLTLGIGTALAVGVTTAGISARAATGITIASFTPAATIPAGTSVYIGNCIDETTPYSFNVPSAPFQGYLSRFEGNHLARVRSVVAGGFASDLHVSYNAWMHDTGSSLAAAPSTLTAPLVKGATYTALDVTALDREVVAGDVVQVGVGETHQETVATADAAAGATSVAVASFVASAAFASGTRVFNTAHMGAMIESFGIDSAANMITAEGNRCGFSGGFSFIARLSGPTVKSYLAGNNSQDFHVGPVSLALYRFDRDAVYNTVIAGLDTGISTLPPADDFSFADGGWTQVYIGSGVIRGPHEGGLAVRTSSGRSQELAWWTDGTERFRMFGVSGDPNLYLRDVVNARYPVVIHPGVGTYQSDVILDANVSVAGYLTHSGVAAAFFGAEPTTKPTGVAVTAEGIHAALVTLGLIGS